VPAAGEPRASVWAPLVGSHMVRRSLRPMSLRDALPDRERQQWTFDPFVSVGPPRFGISSDAATSVLGGAHATVRRHYSHWNIACHAYPNMGLQLYFSAGESLCGISVDALRGASGSCRRGAAGRQGPLRAGAVIVRPRGQ
jgi:hypothetical protein